MKNGESGEGDALDHDDADADDAADAGADDADAPDAADAADAADTDATAPDPDADDADAPDADAAIPDPDAATSAACSPRIRTSTRPPRCRQSAPTVPPPAHSGASPSQLSRIPLNGDSATSVASRPSTP